MTAGGPRPAAVAAPATREIDDLTLARARHGDRQAQGRVVEHYGAMVYAAVSRMLLTHRALIDDVAQDALVKVLRALPRFTPTGPARLSTWILTIAMRTAIDALRTQSPGVVLEEDALRSAGSPELQADRRQIIARVVAAMAELPADQRAALVLRAYHELDYPDIAAALGVSEGTVKSRLSRARAALRAAVPGGWPMDGA